MAKSRTIAFLIALLIGLTSATTAAASPISKVAAGALADVTGKEATAMTDAAMNAVKSGEVNPQAPENSLNPAGSRVYNVGTNEGTFTTVTVPISGDYSLVSNLSIVFNSAGDMVQFAETLVSENEAGNFNVTSYTDGALVSNQDTDLAFMSDAELREDLAKSQSDEPAQGQAAEKNTGACLATVLGISGVLGGIIAYACAGACAAAAAGVGVPFCVGCIAGFAVIGGASITAVASCF